MLTPAIARPIEIRSYNSDDYSACRDLWVELTEHHRLIYDAPRIGGDDPWADFDVFLADQRCIAAWVATEDNAIVGLAGLLTDGDGVELEPMIVSASARSRGIGQRPIDGVFSDARQRGMRSISVKAVARNADAMAFYHGVGFRILGYVELMAFLDDESATGWQSGIEIHGEIYDY